jgi:hypothetical protein
MLPFAIFISICIAAVLFLLRFLYAIEAESMIAQAHSETRIGRPSIYPSEPQGMAHDSFAGLRLVRSNTSRPLVGEQSVFTSASVPRERNSHYKGA